MSADQTGQSPLPAQVPDAVRDRPELLVVAALAGGFLLAKVLKRIVG